MQVQLAAPAAAHLAAHVALRVGHISWGLQVVPVRPSTEAHLPESKLIQDDSTLRVAGASEPPH